VVGIFYVPIKARNIILSVEDQITEGRIKLGGKAEACTNIHVPRGIQIPNVCV